MGTGELAARASHLGLFHLKIYGGAGSNPKISVGGGGSKIKTSGSGSG